MFIKFNDSEEFIHLGTRLISSNMVEVVSKDLVENLSGFKLYEDDKETVVKDCSDFIYRWDIHVQKENHFCYTNSETYRQRQPKPDDPDPIEIIDPLSNEELTSCVADLMFETSLMKLGMEVD